MDRVMLSGLVKIELPGVTLRLCDGAFIKWGAETFDAEDATFGAIRSIEAISEGVGDEIPALRINFLPRTTAAAAELSQPDWQGSRVRMWIAEVDPDTYAITGTPELMFYGQTDSTKLITGRARRELVMDVTSAAERLFVVNEANTLSPRFHKLLYPGELGEDNAVGVGVGVAWGTAQPTTYSGSGFAAGGKSWLDLLKQ
ncbi:MAG: hypothetical protein WA940_09220 [Sphingopyxis sp.]